MRIVIPLFVLIASAYASPLFAPQDKIKDLEVRLKSNPNDASLLMDLGRLYHDKAAAGDGDAVEKGLSMFGRLLSLDSTNVVAMAYHGALVTMEGRDSWWPPNKLKYMREGCAELDKAVELDQSNLMVHLIRGINGLGLPDYAGRLPKALEDFIILLRRPDFQEQSKELKVLILYYGGVAHKKADDYDRARELFNRAIKIFPESQYAKNAEDELREMGREGG
ncbi:MAG TPA: tetratricopeptide repeat protein [Bacteroidota bacterium]|nr:tetratricopeptide repeat protein [Bacteroidota bacterium]